MNQLFIINMAHREDRKQHMLNEIKIQQITQFEFFVGMKLSMSDLNKWNPNYCEHVRRDIHPAKFLNYRLGALGCLQSHLNIYRLALERGYESIMILEDDTTFTGNMDVFESYIKQLNGEYDMLYLAGSHLSNPKLVEDNLFKVIKTYTTGSYCIRKKAMQYIVDNIQSYSKEIDVFLAEEVQPRFQCYVIQPHLTRQRDGYSDIQQGNVKYKI